MKAEPQKFKTIIDINKHGIRRERYAAGYPAVSKMKKKEKKKNVSHETK
jgi:hypothetical protein